MTEEEIGRMAALVESTAKEVHILRQGQAQLISLIERLAVMDNKFQDHNKSLDNAHKEIREMKKLIDERQSVIEWVLNCKDNVTKFIVGAAILGTVGIVGWLLMLYRVVK